MPANDVALKAHFKRISTPQPQKYNITTSVIGNIGGIVTANPTSQEQGKDVTITVKPDDGYEITTLTLNGKPIGPQLKPDGTYTFTMGDKPVNVVATFNKKDVKKFIVGSENHGWGSVSVDPTESRDGNAKVGEKVTFSLSPYDGYMATKATVTKNKGIRLWVDVDESGLVLNS